MDFIKRTLQKLFIKKLQKILKIFCHLMKKVILLPHGFDKQHQISKVQVVKFF